MPWWGTLIVSAVIPIVVALYIAKSNARQRRSDREANELQRQRERDDQDFQRERDRETAALDGLEVLSDLLTERTGKVFAILRREMVDPNDVDPDAHETLDMWVRTEEGVRREAGKVKSRPEIWEKALAATEASDRVRMASEPGELSLAFAPFLNAIHDLQAAIRAAR